MQLNASLNWKFWTFIYWFNKRFFLIIDFFHAYFLFYTVFILLFLWNIMQFHQTHQTQKIMNKKYIKILLFLLIYVENPVVMESLKSSVHVSMNFIYGSAISCSFIPFWPTVWSSFPKIPEIVLNIHYIIYGFFSMEWQCWGKGYCLLIAK